MFMLFNRFCEKARKLFPYIIGILSLNCEGERNASIVKHLAITASGAVHSFSLVFSYVLWFTAV